MFQTYSFHGFYLGSFNSIEEAMKPSEGWEIINSVGKVVARRKSVYYNNNSWIVLR